MKIDQDLTKLYYSIGEVAEMFEVSNSLIRYWETEFNALKPTKNKKGDRRFKVKDIRTLERIYTLVKERGFTLEGAKKELKSNTAQSSTSNKDEIIQKLRATKQKLENMLRELNS